MKIFNNICFRKAGEKLRRYTGFSVQRSATILILLIALAQSSLADPKSDSTQELKALIETFRVAVIDQNREKEFYDLFLHDKITWVTIYEGKTKEKLLSNNRYRPFISSSFTEFYEFLKSGKYEEKFYNVEISSDKNYANIKFDYTFHKEDKIQNWGKEYWTLLKTNGKWKITSVIWTTNLEEIEKCPFKECRRNRRGISSQTKRSSGFLEKINSKTSADTLFGDSRSN